MKQCLECKAEFEPKNPKGVFCSTKCRQKDYRRKINQIVKASRSKIFLEAQKEERANPFISAARGRDKSGVNEDENKHKLWKAGDPKENSMAFYLKYDCYTYIELENKLK